MARMILTVPDAIGQRVVDNFALRHGYEDTITDAEGNEAPNPQSKFDFMGEKVSQFIVDSVTEAEVYKAQQQARESARVKAASEIVITVSR